MPTRLDDNPNRIDDHYNENDGRYGTARSLDEQERGAFDDIEKNYDKNADSSQKDSNIQKVKDRESTPSGNWGVNRDSFGSPEKSSGPKSFNLKSFGKKKGPMGVVILLLVGAILGPMAVMPILGPLMFFENVTKDLNDMVNARDERGFRMARNKIPTADREQAIRGCTKLTIRCKFATISSKQVAKLSFAQIEVVEKKGFSLPNRIVPEAYIFEGKKFTPDEWGRELRTNPNAIRAQRLANNARFSSVSDKAFINRVYKRFGITKRAPELKGKTANERVQALINKAGTGDIADLKFTEVKDEDGERTGKYTLEGDASGTTYDSSQKARLEKDITRVRGAKPPSKATKASIGALSVLGYWDIACSMKNMIGGATTAAKVANQQELIQYVAPVASLTYKVKAGDATPEDAEVIGKFFNDTDARKEIASVSKSKFTQTEKIGLDGDVAQIANPDYGKSALNSELYNMSTNGGIAPRSETSTALSLGFGANALLGFMSGAAATAAQVINLGQTNNGACKVVQNWLVRTVGIVGTVLLAAFSGGSITAGQVATMAGLVAAMFILNTIINNALKGSLIENNDLTNNTVGRGDAAWTGLGGMMSAGSQANGMMPANAEEIAQYQTEQKKTLAYYDEIERSKVKNQLDITNEYSYLGSITRSFATALPRVQNFSSLFTSMVGFSGSSLASAIRSPVANASTLDPKRFEQCDDESYKNMGIDADVQCNVRFVMPKEDLELDTDVVAKYMEDNGLVDPETGIPKDYTPPDPQAAQGGAMSTIKDVAGGFIPHPPEDYPNDYARFLEFCAYRTMPFGETYKDGGDDEWSTGEKCRTKGAPFSYYRAYTMDMAVSDAEDNDAENTGGGGDSTATGTETPASDYSNASGKCDLSKIPANTEASGACWALKNNTDYSSIPCAAGSTDNGVKNNPANGVTVRACLVKGKPVASVISQNVVSLVTDAQKDGVNITLSSGLRSYSEQVRLYAQNCNSAGSCNPPTAKPGTSNHEKGTAVDWGLNGASFCYKRSTCGAGENAGYDWFQKNAAKYGFFKLSTEAWHWSTNAQ